ncbi:UbiA prenyltransferase family-domain-containing protein [Vararia minispora EC-137]|uniref:UbiA prenyltransferase family-domain-containing protein n=1 Tax=Vararia minispora EC-137 TaxID=1314806 RepID=A0ACB8QDH0_9AGAM|nr:UbiA prenyltransferase family-domain-containing protein [Vararia minispora EC-137]
MRCSVRLHSTTVQGSFSAFFSSNHRYSSAAANADSVPTPPAPPLPQSAFRPISPLTPSRLLGLYGQLSKTHLSALVVLTAMAPVALSPLPASVPVLLATGAGTALCCASANAFNELQEAPFDAQMARTRARPLVRRAITPLHAALFATGTGITGPTILWTLVNPTTAMLGAFNIFLYAGLYTSMKRYTAWNTWIGAVVGGIPPLMGWAAVGGHLIPSPEHPITLFLPSFLSNTPLPDIAAMDNALAPWALFLLMFSWQFPHFNALSHFVRDAYAQGGFHMLCVLDPRRNALVALRHTLLMTTISSVLVPLSGLTTWAFALTSMPMNAVLVRAAWRFYREGSERHARRLFHHSLWYLPVILGLMMVHKQGVDWSQWIGLSKGDAVKAVEA